MTRILKFRRGNTVDHSAFTGSEGEVTINTDKDCIIIHDGTTLGGFEHVNLNSVQRLTNKNITATELNVTGVSTFAGIVDANGGAEIDNIRIGVANDNTIDTSTGNLTLDSNGGQVIVNDQLTVNGSVYLRDNDTLNFGTQPDLYIYHNGSNSFIQEVGTGNLYLTSDGSEITLAKGNVSEYMARFITDGSVELYYDNSKKFETTGYGITVFETTQSQQLNISGVSTFNGAVSFGTTAYFGADDEIVLNNKFKIYTDASNTYLKNFDTNTGGDLYIQSDVTLIQKYDGTETIARFTEGAGVELNYQGQARLSTVATGVIVGDNSAGTAHIPSELRIGTVTANQSNASIMIANSSGVGIGTTNPTSKLHVIGNARVSGVVTATTFIGALTGTATTATNVTLASGSATSNYVTFSETATGNQPLKTDAGLTYNASTNVLGASISGTATNATNVNLAAGTATANYVVFSQTATGNQPLKTDTGLTYNASTNVLGATVSGSAASWTTGRTIALTGDVTGTSGAFNGTANLSFATTLASGVVSAANLDGAQSGSAPIYGARAWCNLNGSSTPSIRADGNVSSVTKLGSGHWRLAYTTAMPSANYAAVVSGAQNADSNDNTFAPHSLTTTTVNIISNNVMGGLVYEDAVYVFLAVFV